MPQIINPSENSVLEGHQDAERILLDAWLTSRVHHAWLITGPKGIGKATLAYRYAKFLLANGYTLDNATEKNVLKEKSLTNNSISSLYIDPANPTFRRVAAHSHTDLHLIERTRSEDGKKIQTSIPVDRIRSVKHSMSLTSGENSWRIVIIDGAEDMNSNSANALLKLLEEPPPRSIILLVSHTWAKLLPTIRSRCIELSLSPLDVNTLKGLIKRYRPDLSPDDSHMLCRMASGSIGRALEIADNNGLELQNDLLKIFKSLPTMDLSAVQKFSDLVAKRDGDKTWKNSIEITSRNIADIVEVFARNQEFCDRGYNNNEAKILTRLLELASPQQWLEVWETNNQLFAEADTINLDRKQVMLSALTNIENTLRSSI